MAERERVCTVKEEWITRMEGDCSSTCRNKLCDASDDDKRMTVYMNGHVAVHACIQVQSTGKTSTTIYNFRNPNPIVKATIAIVFCSWV